MSIPDPSSLGAGPFGIALDEWIAALDPVIPTEETWVVPRGDARSPEEYTDLAARCVWNGMVEAGDGIAGLLILGLGAAAALATVEAEWAPETIADALPEALVGAAERGRVVRGIAAALERWRPRRERLDPLRSLHRAAHAGVLFLTPSEPEWPVGCEDLGIHGPIALWCRGNLDALARLDRAISVVGARACTRYGEQVALEFSEAIALSGIGVVSGAAYGIDGAAHRAALAARGNTVAILAGGVDRPYPSGHTTLLAQIAREGAVLSESVCGAAPTRWRFLQRNRLIAAVSGVTIVIEAGQRSGALNTAGHAQALGRALCAVPGPVTVTTSAGCHTLIAEGRAVLVTRPAEAIEMLDLGGAGVSVPAEYPGAVPTLPGGALLSGEDSRAAQVIAEQAEGRPGVTGVGRGEPSPSEGLPSAGLWPEGWWSDNGAEGVVPMAGGTQSDGTAARGTPPRSPEDAGSNVHSAQLGQGSRAASDARVTSQEAKDTAVTVGAESAYADAAREVSHRSKKESGVRGEEPRTTSAGEPRDHVFPGNSIAAHHDDSSDAGWADPVVAIIGARVGQDLDKGAENSAGAEDCVGTGDGPVVDAVDDAADRSDSEQEPFLRLAVDSASAPRSATEPMAEPGAPLGSMPMSDAVAAAGSETRSDSQPVLGSVPSSGSVSDADPVSLSGSISDLDADTVSRSASHTAAEGRGRRGSPGMIPAQQAQAATPSRRRAPTGGKVARELGKRAGLARVAEAPQSVEEKRVLDVLPLRGTMSVMDIAVEAGLAREVTRVALGLLELAALVEPRDGEWALARRP